MTANHSIPTARQSEKDPAADATDWLVTHGLRVASAMNDIDINRTDRWDYIVVEQHVRMHVRHLLNVFKCGPNITAQHNRNHSVYFTDSDDDDDDSSKEEKKTSRTQSTKMQQQHQQPPAVAQRVLTELVAAVPGGDKRHAQLTNLASVRNVHALNVLQQVINATEFNNNNNNDTNITSRTTRQSVGDVSVDKNVLQRGRSMMMNENPEHDGSEIGVSKEPSASRRLARDSRRQQGRDVNRWRRSSRWRKRKGRRAAGRDSPV